MQYQTIREANTAEYVVKRSRFLGHVAPVTTQDEAVEFLQQIRSRHWDATHNVYAYRLRTGQSQRYSDDGEPQGTAGMPVLGVLQKSELVDCIVVVTRYFGGVMLGAGGLVRAYSHTASLAVQAGGIVTRAKCRVARIICDYAFYGTLAALIPESGGTIQDSQYAELVTVTYQVPLALADRLEAKLVDASFGRYHSEPIAEVYTTRKDD